MDWVVLLLCCYETIDWLSTGIIIIPVDVDVPMYQQLFTTNMIQTTTTVWQSAAIAKSSFSSFITSIIINHHTRKRNQRKIAPNLHSSPSCTCTAKTTNLQLQRRYLQRKYQWQRVGTATIIAILFKSLSVISQPEESTVVFKVAMAFWNHRGDSCYRTLETTAFNIHVFLLQMWLDEIK